MKNSHKLALLGGTPVRHTPMKPYNTMGIAEQKAALSMMKSGRLSGFHGTYDDRFLGGPFVKAFEKAFQKRFRTAHAVSFNSATTALQAAIAACGIGPGDEVITSPFTMAATPIAVLLNGAIPVFADIDDRTFNIDPESVRKLVSPRTKAILAVNIFGGACDFDRLQKIATDHKLFLIEDNAQGIGATYKKRYLGTIGHIGVFSFNVHKILQAGEGGVLVTDDKNLAFRAQMVRNHGEIASHQVYQDTGTFEPIIGSNYRMTEVHAAIAHAQLRRMREITGTRLKLIHRLTCELKRFEWIRTPYTVPESTHAHFLYPLMFDEKKAGTRRDTFIEAMKAEGIPVSPGYVTPLYLLTVFQKRQMFPQSLFPFDRAAPEVSYEKGICPVTERIHEHDMVMLNIIHHAPTSIKDIQDIIRAVEKIDAQRSELTLYEKTRS